MFEDLPAVDASALAASHVRLVGENGEEVRVVAVPGTAWSWTRHFDGTITTTGGDDHDR